VLAIFGDPQSPYGIEELPTQSSRYFLWLGVHFPTHCLEVSPKFLPLCISIHSYVSSPSEFCIWPAHTLFLALLAALLLSVARPIFYVPETACRGRR
jgi:hypothetical protein